MNAELPLFKNGEHNSEIVSTLDRGLTPWLFARHETDKYVTSHFPIPRVKFRFVWFS